MLVREEYSKLKLGFVIFSRLDSHRLPRKALLKIQGKTLLERVIDRCKNVALNLPIIIATSDRPVDDEIVTFAESKKIKFFRGPLDDVALRAINCCTEFNLDAFIRVCGDRIFMPYEIVNLAIDLFNKTDVDLVSNFINQTYPKGCTVEIINTNSLKWIYKQGLDTYEKEHITSFFYNNQEKFRIKNIPDYIEDAHNHNLSLDTIADLEKYAKMIKNFNGNIEKISLKETLILSHKWDLEALNDKK